MYEYQNEHLLMKHHEVRRKALMDEARRERLKNEVIRQAASQQQQLATTRPVMPLWRRIWTLLGRYRPASPPTISFAEDGVGYKSP